MPPSHARTRVRSGAGQGSNRRQRHSHGKWATFDRWLDRLVALAVVAALVVGAVALILPWFLDG